MRCLSKGVRCRTGIVDIAMITSLGREDNINELVRNYGMVSDDLLQRGVSIVVLTVTPEDYPEDGRDQHSIHIQRMESSGIKVIKQNKYRERFAVIDRSLVWYGSMNLLSNEKDDDSLMRINNPAVAEELLEFAALLK